jgi:endoglucanase
VTAKFKDLEQMLLVESECGNEREFSEYCAKLLEQYTGPENISIDRLNNVIAYIGDRTKKKIMLTAHLDELSMIVTGITDEGFVNVYRVGGVDRRTLLSAEVTVAGNDGIICSTPPHLTKPGEGNKVPEYKNIYIDLGLKADEVKKRVKIGDRVRIKAPVTELLNGRFASKALDNKLCCFAILTALRKLKKLIAHKELDCCIVVMFASEEEVGSRGATVGTYGIEPDEALVLDVTFAKQADAPGHGLGEGAVIEFSSFFDRKLMKAVDKAAKDRGIKHQYEANGAAYGTDADTIPVIGNGVRTGLISIPVRYMHTPVEVGDMDDVESAADILAAYLRTYEIGGEE